MQKVGSIIFTPGVLGVVASFLMELIELFKYDWEANLAPAVISVCVCFGIAAIGAVMLRITTGSWPNRQKH